MFMWQTDNMFWLVFWTQICTQNADHWQIIWTFQKTSTAESAHWIMMYIWAYAWIASPEGHDDMKAAFESMLRFPQLTSMRKAMVGRTLFVWLVTAMSNMMGWIWSSRAKAWRSRSRWCLLWCYFSEWGGVPNSNLTLVVLTHRKNTGRSSWVSRHQASILGVERPWQARWLQRILTRSWSRND